MLNFTVIERKRTYFYVETHDCYEEPILVSCGNILFFPVNHSMFRGNTVNISINQK